MNEIDKLKERISVKNYSKMELDVINEMFELGLDPYNPKEVKAYWKWKGVDLDAINPSNPPYRFWSYNK